MKRRPGRPRQGPETLDGARRRKESALADLREMEVRKRAGDLVVAAAVMREQADENRRIRSRMLAVPSRVRARCPLLTAADIAVVDREIRDALQELADADPEAGNG